MKKLVIIIGVLFILSLFSSAYAAEVEELETEAGTPADSLFKHIDRITEKIQIMLVKAPEEKAKLHLKIAEERLAEAKQMLDRNKPAFAEKSLEDYKEELSKATDELNHANEQGTDVAELEEQFNSKISGHATYIDAFAKNIPDPIKDAVSEVKEITDNSKEKIADLVELYEEDKVALEQDKVDANPEEPKVGEVVQYLSDEARAKLFDVKDAIAETVPEEPIEEKEPFEDIEPQKGRY